MVTAPADASRRGTRTRSGNAMGRTRSALLDAAAECVIARGARATTMGQLALTGGVAKATLYNHFRTKDEVLAALVDSRVGALGADGLAVARDDGLAAALERAAAGLAADDALRAVATGEPALLLPLLGPEAGPGWDAARTAVTAVLDACGVPCGPGAVDTVLRWLVGQLLRPSQADQARVGAQVLALGLAAAPVEAVRPQDAGAPTDLVAHPPSGLGWPA